MMFTLGNFLASIATCGKPIGPVWMHIGRPSSASISQALNDFGLSSSLGSKSLVEPPVKMRSPARPWWAQPLIVAATSSPSMSTEPTATRRSGCWLQPSTTYELSKPYVVDECTTAALATPAASIAAISDSTVLGRSCDQSERLPNNGAGG